jgi:hypothetical protein
VPNGHSGGSPFWLLQALGVRNSDMDELLASFGGVVSTPFSERRPPKQAGPFAHRWDTFQPATFDREALDYLALRGFWRPAATALQFDLRVGFGRWAGRLWFPITYADAIIGYTGRSMRGHQPKYLTEAADTVMYLPSSPQGAKLLIIVEGPIDALRLADFMLDRYNIFVTALCGLAITPTKRLQLLALARLIPYFFVVLDSSVSAVNANRLVTQLATLPIMGVRRLNLPPGIDDPGEMSGEEVELWLRETGLANLAV